MNNATCVLIIIYTQAKVAIEANKDKTNLWSIINITESNISEVYMGKLEGGSNNIPII